LALAFLSFCISAFSAVFRGEKYALKF